MAKTYRVRILEEHFQGYLVDADSEEEAIEKAVWGECELIDGDLELQCTLDDATWEVEEYNG